MSQITYSLPNFLDVPPHEYYYYYRDKNKAPRVTICILLDYNSQENYYVIHKGYSLCSLKDNPDTLYGKLLARARAYEARTLGEKIEKSSKRRLLPIKRSEAYDVLNSCDCADLFGMRKGIYNADIICPFEDKLVKAMAIKIKEQIET